MTKQEVKPKEIFNDLLIPVVEDLDTNFMNKRYV